MILESKITCSFCKHEKIGTMPVNSCLFFYTCEKCSQRIKPKSGDCCVFCSYGNISCPPIQESTLNNCCRE